MQIGFQEVLQKPLEVLGRAPIVLVPALCAGVVNLAVSFVRLRTWTVFAFSALGMFVTLFCLAWGVLLLEKYLRGEKPDLVESWDTLSQKAPNVVVTAIIVAALVTLGAYFFILPGILLEAILIMTIPHTAQENATFDKALLYSLRFAFQGMHFLILLLYVAIAFGLAFIPYAGEMLSNIFIIVWIAHLYLTCNQKFVDRPL